MRPPCRNFVDRTGADFVHPYNDPRVIAGQATCSLELVESAGPFDIVIAPIGGGGMISGSCLTLTNVAPETKIYAAEPENADDARAVFEGQGRSSRTTPRKPWPTVSRFPLRERTWHFVSSYVTDILACERGRDRRGHALDVAADEDRHRALLRGAAGCHPERTTIVFAGRRISVVLSKGGNVDLNKLPWMPK